MKAGWATEDWWAVWIGMTVFALSLPVVAGLDVLGWGVTTRVWMNPADAMAPVSKTYAGLPGFVSVALTYLFMLALMSIGARALGVSAHTISGNRIHRRNAMRQAQSFTGVGRTRFVSASIWAS
jgi:hypothetical protein